jgi:hypothetical protein
MQRFDVLVILSDSQRLGVSQRHLEFTGQLVHAHILKPGPWGMKPA